MIKNTDKRKVKTRDSITSTGTAKTTPKATKVIISREQH